MEFITCASPSLDTSAKEYMWRTPARARSLSVSPATMLLMMETFTPASFNSLTRVISASNRSVSHPSNIWAISCFSLIPCWCSKSRLCRAAFTLSCSNSTACCCSWRSVSAAFSLRSVTILRCMVSRCVLRSASEA